MDFYLFQISTGAKYSKLSKTQFVQTLRQGVSFTDWLCWTPGFASWKKLEACPDLLQWVKHNWSDKDEAPEIPEEYVLSKPVIPPTPVREDTITARVEAPPEEPTIIVDAHAQENENITIEFEVIPPPSAPNSNSFSDKRKHPRVKGRLRTILTNKAKAFITYSRDISLGGISVEHSIPKEILQGEVEVYISDPMGKKSVVFICNPVEMNGDSNRFTFSKTDEKQLTKLTSWLDELSRGKAS